MIINAIICILVVASLPKVGRIKGVVKDSTGKPLELVNVSLDGTTYGAATDSQGYYIISDVPHGDYTIMFSMVGYKIVEKKAEVKAKEILRVNAELSPKAIKMKEIEVTSERAEFERDVGVSTMKIGVREIDKMPSFFQSDLLRIIQSMPGVITVGDFSTALYVRGGNCDQNLVQLDGVTLFNPFHLGGFLSTFDVDAVRNVNFITGGFPARFGGRLSSVLDVYTRTGNQEKFSGIGNIGLLYSKLLLEGPIPAGSFLISARRTYLDKVLPLFNAEFPYYFYDIQTKLNFNLSDNTKTSLSGFCNQDVFDFGEGGNKIYLDWGNQTASLSFSHIFSPQLFSKSYLTRSKFSYEVDVASGLFSVKDDLTEWAIKSNFTYYINKHELESGIETKRTEFNYKESFQGGFKYDVVAIPYEVAFYLQDKWKPNDKIILQPGIRLNYFWAEYEYEKEELAKPRRHWRLAPRFAFKYFFSRDMALKGAVGKYFQFVTALIPEENPAPFIFPWAPIFGGYYPEEAWHYILGIEKWLSKTITLSVESYYKNFEGLLTFNEQSDPEDFVGNIFHIGKGNSYGIDILLKKRVGGITGWLGYSISEAQVTFNNKDYPPRYDRRHNLNLIGETKLLWNITFSTKFTFGSGTPYTPIIGWYPYYYILPRTGKIEKGWKNILGEKNSTRFPDYHRMDIGFTRNFTLKRLNFSLTLSVINVYNQKNVLLYYYDYSNFPPERGEIYTIPRIPCLELHLSF